MNIKAGNYVVVGIKSNNQPETIITHLAIREASERMQYLRDFLQPHEIGTALIEVERLRRLDAEEIVNVDFSKLVFAANQALHASFNTHEGDNKKLSHLIDAGVLIANAIEHIVKNAK